MVWPVTVAHAPNPPHRCRPQRTAPLLSDGNAHLTTLQAMTKQQHPITPPPELRQLWAQQAQRMDPHDPVAWQQYVATQAAQWGADQELEACCEWLEKHFLGVKDWSAELRAARRPKPPSLAEQALEQLNGIETVVKAAYGGDLIDDYIRRALERLQELEAGQ